MKLKLLALSTGVILANAQLVSAAPNAFQDTRSFAMGGTGVAASTPAAASFHNPALLAIKHEEKHDGFGLILPSVNAAFADDEEVIDQIDDLQDDIDDFNNLTDPDEIKAAAAQLSSQFSKLDNDTAKADIGIGTALVIPNDRFAVSVFVGGTSKVTVRSFIDDDDIALLDTIANSGSHQDLDETNLKSEAVAIAGVIGELGVSFATAFDIGDNKLTVGVSPKYVSLITYEYVANIATFDEDDFDEDDYKTDDNSFNMDIGVAYQFGEEGQWIAGLMVKNIIPTDLETTSGYSMDVDPLATIGIAYSRDWFTLTSDVDLTENKAFGFEDDNQFVSVGTEFDLADLAQFRLGVRHNIGDTSDSEGVEEGTKFTAGLGFSPFGVHIELSGLVSDTEYGAAAELGFTF